jgi:4-hydroxyphenylpyruvate dioxygenase
VTNAIATVSLSGTLEDKLQAAAHAGFDAVEVFENDLVASPLTPADVRRVAEDLGLEIAMYQPFRDFEGVGPERLERHLRRAERKLAVMEELGAPLLLVCSSVAPDTIDDDALAAEQLALLADRAAEHGIRVAYEALAWGRHVNRYEHAWRIVELAGHPGLGTCLDSFHILSRGDDPAGIRAIPGEKLFFLQLADAPRLAMDVLQWSRHHRCFPGQGGFDLAGLCREVLAAGYEGPLSLEVFNDVFRRADPRRMAEDAMRSLLVLRDELGIDPLPAAAPLSRYAFVELAVDASSGPAVEGLLGAAAFARIGPHRTKPVQLWRHDAVNVVLNHEAGAGPRVVALAVDSADPDRSAERAGALLAPTLERRRGPQEADLSSIAAPDGTSIIFCGRGRSWTEDFVALDADDGAGGGRLRAIDHVALSQPFDLFDEAALFYGSVLGLHADAGEELAAPDGLVRSRPVANDAGTVRIALNVPVLAGGSHPSTADLQHVAFATDDALATAEAWRDRGVPLLSIPQNYYDDLDARLEIDPELLERLRSLGVLYDRAGRGELLHFYTPLVGDRLFFEVVERRGGYDGYGAANSPIRMSAQRRGVRASARR